MNVFRKGISVMSLPSDAPLSPQTLGPQLPSPTSSSALTWILEDCLPGPQLEIALHFLSFASL